MSQTEPDHPLVEAVASHMRMAANDSDYAKRTRDDIAPESILGAMALARAENFSNGEADVIDAAAMSWIDGLMVGRLLYGPPQTRASRITFNGRSTPCALSCLSEKRTLRPSFARKTGLA